MLIDLRDQPQVEDVVVDLCILGGGPAGLTIAHELASTGARILVLESGFVELDPRTQGLLVAPVSGPIADQYPTYLGSSRLRVLGGSQLPWGGWITPLLPLDLEPRSWVADSGWPISFSELASYYRRAARHYRISEHLATPLPESPSIQALVDRRYGFTPRRLSSRDVTLPELASSANVRVLLGAHATHLERSTPDRVTAVHVRTLAGTRFVVQAGTYVLALGGVENARLLLCAEATDGRPFGTGHEHIGRCFMEHPHYPIGEVRLRDPAAWRRYFGGFDPELGHAALRAVGVSSEDQRRLGLLNAAIQLSPVGEPEGECQSALMLLRGEQSPNRKSRLVLDDRVDALGLRAARLEWSLTPQDWDSVVRSSRIIADALATRTVGLPEITVEAARPWPSIPSRPDLSEPWGCHHMGTTRMSETPATGVVDPHGRVHGMLNLHVAGSSLFPTGGYANPTFTVVALAIRLADRLRAPQ